MGLVSFFWGSAMGKRLNPIDNVQSYNDRNGGLSVVC